MNKRQVIYLLKKYKELVLLGSISLIAFIIGSLVIGWLLSFVIIGAIDLLLFFPNKDQWLKKDKGGKNVKIDNYTQNTRSARSANAKTANKDIGEMAGKNTVDFMLRAAQNIRSRNKWQVLVWSLFAGTVGFSLITLANMGHTNSFNPDHWKHIKKNGDKK